MEKLRLNVLANLPDAIVPWHPCEYQTYRQTKLNYPIM